MRVGLHLAARADLVLRLHQRPLLLILLLRLGPLPAGASPAIGGARAGVRLVVLDAHAHVLDGPAVLVHGAQGLADAEEQHHEAALGEAVVVDEVGVDHVLQVAASVVGQQHVDRLGGLVGAALGGDGVVDGRDDGGHMFEEAVGVDLAHRLLHGFGAERAADLLEGEELAGRGVFDEVDIRETAL